MRIDKVEHFVPMDTFARIFGKQVKAHRKTAGEIASDLGISVRTLNNYMANKRTPRPSQLQAIADYFGISLDYLMSGREEPFLGVPQIVVDIDNALLETSIELVETGLKNTTSKPSPAKKAVLIVSVLEHLTENPKDYSKTTIKNMIRLAT